MFHVVLNSVIVSIKTDEELYSYCHLEQNESKLQMIPKFCC